MNNPWRTTQPLRVRSTDLNCFYIPPDEVIDVLDDAQFVAEGTVRVYWAKQEHGIVALIASKQDLESCAQPVI